MKTIIISASANSKKQINATHKTPSGRIYFYVRDGDSKVTIAGLPPTTMRHLVALYQGHLLAEEMKQQTDNNNG